MNVYWSKDFSVGVDFIDEQHQEMFKQVNRLVQACAGGKAEGEVVETMAFLQDYLKAHFVAEEKLMRRENYPDYQAHLQEHTDFRARLTDLEERLEQQGLEPELINEFSNTVIDWLIDHICSVDRALGKYLLADK